MIEIINNHGVFIVFILMFTNGFFSFPPSEITIAYSGFLVGQDTHSLASLLLAIYLGNLLGTTCLYLIGKKWSDFFKTAISKENYQFKILQKILPSQAFITQFTNFLTLKGKHWVAVFRCFPVLRSIVSLPAGVAKMKFKDFIFYSSIGIFIWAFIWLIVGFSFYEIYNTYGKAFSLIFLILLLAVSVILKRQVTKFAKSSMLDA